MTRLPKSLSLLAVLLAVLMPLEQAHCMGMSVAPGAAGSTCGAGKASSRACCAKSPAGRTASHACCAKSAPPKTSDCPCLKLPPAATPAAQVTPLVPPGLVLAVPGGEHSVAVPERTVAFAPRMDAGPAPPLLCLGAHGLRAPPSLG